MIPSISDKYNALLPNYWLSLYYFIGACIHEYDFKISVKKNFTLLISAIIIFGSFNYYNRQIKASVFVDWYSFENVVNTILLFLLILHLKLDDIPTCIK